MKIIFIYVHVVVFFCSMSFQVSIELTTIVDVRAAKDDDNNDD